MTVPVRPPVPVPKVTPGSSGVGDGSGINAAKSVAVDARKSMLARVMVRRAEEYDDAKLDRGVSCRSVRFVIRQPLAVGMPLDVKRLEARARPNPAHRPRPFRFLLHDT